MDGYGLTLVIFFCLFSFLVTHRFEAVILDCQAIKKVDASEQEKGGGMHLKQARPTRINDCINALSVDGDL